MDTFSFDGRVAVVTGAGRGIGRAYAVLLGALGAKIVVNDLGGGRDGSGSDLGPAESVVAEIVAAGGSAVANGNDVSDPDSAKAIIDQAVAEYGRIDIVVNNAGNIVWGALPDADLGNIERHLDVHVKGSFNTVKAAWPHFLEQGYGRVVLTGSTGMFGLPDNLGYAIAKASMIGMAKSMTVSAGQHDIKINVVAPNAMTRLGSREEGGSADDVPEVPGMEPELVAPLVAYLAHEACQVSGETYVGGAGRTARLFVGVTQGYLNEPGTTPAVADVAANWDAVNDETGYYVPGDIMDWAGHYMSHRTPDAAQMERVTPDQSGASR
ncbi:SDR family NAD(P)-dependent oxidoreductase [Nocardioides sp. cx-169]|uniref:SDR family NAD(P)-dependent oxidoreductase n=1 Tax=Nocardioides sp. cx-169 TaxID=2899080 RepID=UPI001E55CB4E|nr:SDR family NAD(P)-dependent oxidoreductase [Nocardioides sp. cx-169]MCD4533645.1 SDR family NAD(P)-dependent oxidoreductase [Nocardioides sp. cx-169]